MRNEGSGQELEARSFGKMLGAQCVKRHDMSDANLVDDTREAAKMHNRFYDEPAYRNSTLTSAFGRSLDQPSGGPLHDGTLSSEDI